LIRALSVALSEILLIAVIAALIALVLPQVYRSIEMIVLNSSTYIEKVRQWAENILKDYPQLESYVVNTFGSMTDAFNRWISESLLPRINSILSNITTSVVYILRGIYNVVIGIVVSVYILLKKENFLASCKKIMYSVFSLKTAEKISSGLVAIDRVFMSFFVRKIRRFRYHWNSLLYLLHSVPYAVCTAYKLDRGNHEHHTVFWTVYRSNSFGIVGPFGKPRQIYNICYIYYYPPAVRRQYSRAVYTR